MLIYYCIRLDSVNVIERYVQPVRLGDFDYATGHYRRHIVMLPLIVAHIALGDSDSRRKSHLRKASPFAHLFDVVDAHELIISLTYIFVKRKTVL